MLRCLLPASVAKNSQTSKVAYNLSYASKVFYRIDPELTNTSMGGGGARGGTRGHLNSCRDKKVSICTEFRLTYFKVGCTGKKLGAQGAMTSNCDFELGRKISVSEMISKYGA